MAVSVNGLTKKTDTEVTASDITTSDVALISDKVDKLVDQIQKALKFNNNSEKDKKELNATLKDILKQQEQIQDYQETREKLLKRSKNLTKEQREAILEDLDKEVLKIFKNFSSLDEELKDTSLIMASKLGVGKNFNKTFTEILETTKRIEKTAKVNQNIRSRNESIDSARKKVGETVGEGVSNSLGTMLYNSLGPLRIFTDPIFGGKNGFFSATSTLSTALGKKVNSSTKTELESKGGTIGKTGVYIGKKIDELSDKSSNDEDDNGFLDNISEGVFTGIVSALTGDALSKISFSGLVSALGGGLTKIFPWAVAGTTLATIGLGIWKGYSGEWKETLEGVTLKTKALSKEDVDSDNSGGVSGSEARQSAEGVVKSEYANPLNPLSWLPWNLDELSNTLGYSIGQNGISGLFTFGFDYQNLIKEQSSYLMETLNPTGYYNHDELAMFARVLGAKIEDASNQGNWELYDLYTQQQEKLKNNFANNKELQDRYLAGIPDLHYGSLGWYFYDEDSAGERLEKLENSPMYRDALYSSLSSRYAEFLNDAIIYKDNSVYVPHPDDNIILTKDEVSTPVLSGNFEGTLLDILRTIATNTKGSGNVYAINSTPEFDFSMLRV